MTAFSHKPAIAKYLTFDTLQEALFLIHKWLSNCIFHMSVTISTPAGTH